MREKLKGKKMSKEFCQKIKESWVLRKAKKFEKELNSSQGEKNES